MNIELIKILEKINGRDLINIEVGFGFSCIKLTYSHSDYKEIEVKLIFDEIIHISYFGTPKIHDGSIFIGKSELLNINDFLDKSQNDIVNDHVKKYLDKNINLSYFTIEGEIYIDIICKNISVEINGAASAPSKASNK